MVPSSQHDAEPWLIGLVPTAPFPDYPRVWEGVYQYSMEHRNRIRCVFLEGFGSPGYELEHFEGHGLLGSLGTNSAGNFLDKSSIPFVNLFRHGRKLEPVVSVDYRETARLLVDMFAEKKFQTLHFLFDGDERNNSNEVVEALEGAAKAYGLSVRVFYEGKRTLKRGKWVLEDQLLDLEEWLTETVRPCAVICTNPDHAQRVLKVCRRKGWSVPEEVALAVCWGVQTQCEFSDPPLTSCHIDYAQVGYVALSTLHRILEHPEEPPPRIQLLSTVTLHNRMSSDQYAVKDPLVTKLMREMQVRMAEKLSIQDLTDKYRISRSTLERRFRKVTGRKPGEHLRNIRAARARELLVHSKRSLLEIALECGIEDPAQFTRFMRQQYGCTPSELRHQRSYSGVVSKLGGRGSEAFPG